MTAFQQSTILLASIGIAGLLVGYRRRHKRIQLTIGGHRDDNTDGTQQLLSDPIEIHKIYLFAFPPVPHVHNISPFSLKAESFLRLWNIPYEFVPTFNFGSKGQVPYVRLNSPDGHEVPDSNVIISLLKKQFGIDEKENSILSIERRAIAHSVTRMVEEHTTQIGFYYRYGLHMHEFDKVIIPNDWFQSSSAGSTAKTWLVSKIWIPMMQHAFLKKLYWVPFGRHSDSEKWAFCCEDIQSISDYLGDKKYFFGDEATTIDCTLFGHLAQFLYIPMDFPQKRYIHEHCQNLIEYVERFKEQYWGEDW